MSPQTLWDELRKVACTTGLKAARIVQLHYSDVVQAINNLKEKEHPMTVERASELVSRLRMTNGDAATDLFCHFVDFFNLVEDQITMFAQLSGFAIAVMPEMPEFET